MTMEEYDTKFTQQLLFYLENIQDDIEMNYVEDFNFKIDENSFFNIPLNLSANFIHRKDQLMKTYGKVVNDDLINLISFVTGRITIFEDELVDSNSIFPYVYRIQPTQHEMILYKYGCGLGINCGDEANTVTQYHFCKYGHVVGGNKYTVPNTCSYCCTKVTQTVSQAEPAK